MVEKRFYVRRALIILTIVIMVIMTGCDGNTVENALITEENISDVSVVLFDGSEKNFEEDGVNKIVKFIEKTTETRTESVQDTPDKTPLGKISINQGNEVLYYYEMDGIFYIEKPYEGIFKTEENVDEFFTNLQ